MTEYNEHWITTFTGKKFHFLDPASDEIDIKDIAHHLSMLCRFTGATRLFYSVAEHSVRVSDILPERLKLAGLLHDAAEAYTNDISRPVKYTHKLEKTDQVISMAIAEKYAVDMFSPLVKNADNVLIATEARDLMPSTRGWAKLPEPLSYKITATWRPELAEMEFLYWFEQYGGILDD